METFNENSSKLKKYNDFCGDLMKQKEKLKYF